MRRAHARYRGLQRTAGDTHALQRHGCLDQELRLGYPDMCQADHTFSWRYGRASTDEHSSRTAVVRHPMCDTCPPIDEHHLERSHRGRHPDVRDTGKFMSRNSQVHELPRSWGGGAQAPRAMTGRRAGWCRGGSVLVASPPAGAVHLQPARPIRTSQLIRDARRLGVNLTPNGYAGSTRLTSRPGSYDTPRSWTTSGE